MPSQSATDSATTTANSHPGADLRQVLRAQAGRTQIRPDLIATEMPVALIYNQTPFAVMMATPDDLEDFALGFSLSEGLIANVDDLRIDALETSLEGITLQLHIPAERTDLLRQRQRNLYGGSSCGLCGTAAIEAVLRPPLPVAQDLRLENDSLQRALAALQTQQPLNAQTGATHAAGWSDRTGRLALVREDVGRHNALDKLIGALVRKHYDVNAGFAVITSRASYEMVMKTAQVGIQLLAAISAPTTLAIALAETAGLTLVAFAREEGYGVYSHPQRLPAVVPTR